MKDFTTKEYIDPIIAQVKAFYTPIKDPVILKALNCTVLLKNNHTRDYKAVRKQDYFFLYNPAIKDLYAEVKDYANYASTEPGELDTWEIQEKDRIQETIRDRIIEIYA